MSGTITVYFGAMMSGKTSRLLSIIKERERSEMRNGFIHRKRILVIKPKVDKRYAEIVSNHRDSCFIASHDNPQFNNHGAIPMDNEELTPEYVNDLYESRNSNPPRYIFIDEGHFFKNIAEVAQAFKDVGVHIFISGLDMDYRGVEFENMKKVIELADFAHLRKGECGTLGCENPSRYSYYKGFDQDSENQPRLIVGGSESYVPLCETCYNQMDYWRRGDTPLPTPPPSPPTQPPPPTPTSESGEQDSPDPSSSEEEENVDNTNENSGISGWFAQAASWFQ